LAEQAATHATTVADMKKQLSKVESRCDAIIAGKAAHIALLEKQIVKLKASHAATNATLEASHARVGAAKDAAAADLRAALAQRAETTSQLAAVHAAVTSKATLEVHPVRRDRRQFATLHPAPYHTFDTAWCAAVSGDGWQADIDSVTRMRAHVVRHSKKVGSLTLRGAAPLPRHLLSTGTSQQLPSYRVVIEAYPAPFKDEDTQRCRVGFVPSHTSTDGAAVWDTNSQSTAAGGLAWQRIPCHIMGTSPSTVGARCRHALLPVVPSLRKTQDKCVRHDECDPASPCGQCHRVGC
jgi:hypothetical protein